MSNKRKIKFAIIGCGRIAGHNARALENIPDAELVAVCDLIEDKAIKLARQFNCSSFINYYKMLNDMDIDVVNIMTPSGMHPIHAIDIMEKYRKHIVVEKPMALNLNDAFNMIGTAKQKGIQLFSVLQNKFNKPVHKIKELLDSGIFGKLVLGTVRLRWCRPQRYYDRDPWRGTWAFDGGALTNQAIHHIDLLQWFMGEVEEVSAIAATQLVDVEVEDTAIAWIRFKNGGLGVIESTTAVRPDDLEASISLFGEHGSIIIEGTSVNRITYCSFRQVDKDRFSEYPPTIYGYGHVPLLQNVVDCVKGLSNPVVDGNEALKSLRLLHAIYASIETGKRVKMSDNPQSDKLGRITPKDEHIKEMYLTPPYK